MSLLDDLRNAAQKATSALSTTASNVVSKLRNNVFKQQEFSTPQEYAQKYFRPVTSNPVIKKISSPLQLTPPAQLAQAMKTAISANPAQSSRQYAASNARLATETMPLVFGPSAYVGANYLYPGVKGAIRATNAGEPVGRGFQQGIFDNPSWSQAVFQQPIGPEGPAENRMTAGFSGSNNMVDWAIQSARKIVDQIMPKKVVSPLPDEKLSDSPIIKQQRELMSKGVYDLPVIAPGRALLTDLKPSIDTVVKKLNSIPLYQGNPLKPEGFRGIGTLAKGALDMLTGGEYSPEEQALLKKINQKAPLTDQDIATAKQMQEQNLNAMVGSLQGVKSRGLSNTKAAQAVQEVFASRIQRMFQSATDPDMLTKGIDELVAKGVQASKGDKTILAGMRTALAKELSSLAGAGPYKGQWAELMTLRDSPDVGGYVRGVMDSIEKIDDFILRPSSEASQILKAESTRKTGLLPGLSDIPLVSPQRESVPRSAGLTTDQLPVVRESSASKVKPPEKFISKIEEDSFSYLKKNADTLEKEYVEKFGNVVNPDNAKELFRPVGYNKTNAREVHEASSQLAKIAYEDLLKTQKGKGDGVVLFTAGGSGVGKTTAVKNLVGREVADASIIYDSNLANFESASGKIQQAIDAGYKPEIVYVYRDPVKAWDEGVLTRTARGERHVPLDAHIALHENSKNTLQQIAKKFGDQVDITVIDNSGSKGSAKLVPLDFLDSVSYNKEEIKKGIYESTAKALESKRITPDKIPDVVGQADFGRPQPLGQKEVTAAIEKNWEFDSGGAIPGEPLAWTKDNKFAVLEELDQSGEPTGRVTLNDDQGNTQGVFDSVDAAIQSQGMPLVSEARVGRAGGEAVSRQATDTSQPVVGGGAGPPSPPTGGSDLPLVAPEAPPGMKERKFVTTVRGSETTAPEVAEKVRGFYKPIPNQESLANARQLVDTNLDEAIKLAKTPGPASAEKTAVQLTLMSKFQNEKNYEMAIDIAETAAKQATSHGQAIQALFMWSRLTPEGALRYAAKVIDKANEGVALGKHVKLSEDIAKKITDLAEKASGATSEDEKIKGAAKLMDAIADLVPSSIGSKLAEFQTFAQLLNPKTAIRNIMGNFGFAGLEYVKDLVAYPIDVVTGLATGSRSKSLPSLTTQLTGGASGFKLGLEEALQGIDTTGQMTLFDIPKKAMQGKVAEGFRKLLAVELKAPDRAFFQAAYDDSIRQQLKLAKATAPTQDMIEQATYDGLYRTFQDDNMISRAMTGIKNGLNKIGVEGFGLGDLVLKYPKTPGAILSRAVDYSPAGFVKAVFELAKPFTPRGGAFKQKAFVEDVSRALTGTAGLIGTGAILHKLGIITGGGPEDYDIQNVEKEKYGVSKYRLNVSSLMRFVMSGLSPDAAKVQDGDMVMSYDWFQPQAVPIAMGADIDAHDGSAESTVSKIATSISSASNTLIDQPLLTGLADLFGYKDLGRGLQSTAEGTLASFTPTVFNQIKQLIDNTSRNTTDPDITGSTLKKSLAKIPLVSRSLPGRVGTKGQDIETYQGGGNNFFNVLFNPAFVGKFKSDPVGDEVLRLYNESGETVQAPRSVSKSVEITKDGKPEKVKLTGEMQSNMQRYVGQISDMKLGSIVVDPKFQKLPDSEKAKVMQAVITDVMTAAKVKYLGHRPKNLSKKVRNILDDKMEPEVVPAEEALPLVNPSRYSLTK